MGPMADLHFLANPARFRRFSQRVLPGLGFATVLMLAVASPPDYQQGESVRIMYVHVPASWMALFCYTSMAAASAVGLIWRHPVAEMAAKATAPIGACFTFLALLTGSLWGKPMWGTWWVWDARLTSVLILFFLYLGYMALESAFDDPARGTRAASILALVGFVNVPIIKFSVDWWNTLHQPAVRLAGLAAHRDRNRPPPSRECRGRGMSNHAAYILASWLVAAVILGGLVIASLGARRKVRRELAARGLEKRR
jgi:heme exporter protein C